MKNIKVLFAIIIILFAFISCQKEDSPRKCYETTYRVISNEIMFEFTANMGDGFTARGDSATFVDICTYVNEYEKLDIVITAYNQGTAIVEIVRDTTILIERFCEFEANETIRVQY